MRSVRHEARCVADSKAFEGGRTGPTGGGTERSHMCARPQRRTEGRETRAHWREFWAKRGAVPESPGGSPGARETTRRRRRSGCAACDLPSRAALVQGRAWEERWARRGPGGTFAPRPDRARARGCACGLGSSGTRRRRCRGCGAAPPRSGTGSLRASVWSPHPRPPQPRRPAALGRCAACRSRGS